MNSDFPILWWVRRDLRLSDNPALAEALRAGGPVIPVFVLDDIADSMGAAAKWRLGQGLEALRRTLEGHGSRLVLRRGEASVQLERLVAETGARAVYWNRLYEPATRTRDRAVKEGLRARGLDARSFNAHLLHEPWQVATGQGAPYRVFTPFWRALRDRDGPTPLPAPDRLPAPAHWPASDALDSWRMGAAMVRGAAVVARHATVGEAAAERRLAGFLDRLEEYQHGRDIPAAPATSRLSENLTLGEIGPRAIWHAGLRAMQEGRAGAEHFLRQLVWREFSWHLLYHTPHIADRNWRAEWDSFPWRGDNADVERWRQGRTGEPLVDAAMREMYVTGTMHNRGRMIVASYLTKHLMTDWRVGQRWFAECLIDWDPAANAMGWQWVAGSGPDAAPYFRIFNPATQALRFDPDATYRHRHIAELAPDPGREALDYFAAVPESWGLSPDMPYPGPMVDLGAGRARALSAYSHAQGRGTCPKRMETRKD